MTNSTRSKGEAKNLICPICSVKLVKTSLLGQTVDRCCICKGTWFDESELGDVLRAIEPNDLRPMASTNESVELKCPACSALVFRSIFGHNSGIPISKCLNCSGVWLQFGQLEQIAKYRQGSTRVVSLPNASANDLAAQNRLIRFSEIIRSRWLSSSVVVLLLLLMYVLTNDFSNVVRMLVFTVLPMACIWFSDALGNLTGIAKGLARPRVTERTPGIAVAVGGWILLATAFFVALYGFQ